MDPVKIGLLGLGTVGGGTVTVLTRNGREIARRAGRDIQIVHAAARAYDANAISGLDQIGRISDDAVAVGEDPEEDARRFHVTRDGVVLITREMLGQRTAQFG